MSDERPPTSGLVGPAESNAKTAGAWVVGSILGGGVGLAVLGLAMSAWISAEVKTQLEDAGIVPKHEVTAIREDVDENAEDIKTIEDRWNRLVDALAAED